MYLIKKSNIQDSFLLLSIVIAYLIGVLSTQHYQPSFHDFLINTESFLVVSLGLSYWFIKQYKIKRPVRINGSIYLWITLLLIITLQPFVNNIIYIDGIIFPIACVFSVIFLVIAISSISDNSLIVNYLTLGLWLGALGTVISQLCQIFEINFLWSNVVLPVDSSLRPIGNIGQPNQAAFIISLGLISSSQISKLFSKKFSLIFLLTSIFLFVLGIGLSASRGGLILGFLALLGIIYTSNVRVASKISMILISIVTLLASNVLLQLFSDTENAIDRIYIQNSETSLRMSQIEQAWKMFVESPVFGVGWKNFSSKGLEYNESLEWFSFSDHAHNIVSQLSAEFGLIGILLLIYFLWIFYKNINLNKINLSEEISLVILLIIIAYSFSEYPLWDYRYLIIFSVFLTVKIKPTGKGLLLSNSFVFLIAAFNILFYLGSIYYVYHYHKYASMASYVFSPNYDDYEKLERIKGLETPFGFLLYKELMIFRAMPIDPLFLKSKIEMGKNVTSLIPYKGLLLKQSVFYALDNNQREALFYAKADCLYEFSRDCDFTEKYLKKMTDTYPVFFNDLYNDFLVWRSSNYVKLSRSDL